MFSPASIRGNTPGSARTRSFGALGLCTLGLVLAASACVHADDPADKSKAVPQEKAAPKETTAEKPREALTGFNNSTNGFEDQDAFDADQKTFEEVESVAPNGLGPVYNATSCVGCHQSPVAGSSSQIPELRIGHHEPDPDDPRKVVFIEPPSGSLIHQRAIHGAIQERTPGEYEVRTLRMSTSILGDGFVEVLSDRQILDVRDAQPKGLKGLPVVVPVPVGPKADGSGFETVERIGRFGWKCQEASLVNFAAGAYLNEMGVTSPLQPHENTSNGRDVSAFDAVADPEDKVVSDESPDERHPFGVDVEAFTRFMRSTKAPPREFALVGTDDVRAGEALFRNDTALGCAVCHHPDYTTPAAGSLIKPYHGGDGTTPGSDMGAVPEALGNKIIHPFSDFMLHDVGTGDGIAQTQHAQKPHHGAASLQAAPDAVMARDGVVRVRARPHPGGRRALSAAAPGLDMRTMYRIRTTPLWGLRVRPQLLHDGSALTIDEAIRRHKGQAEEVTKRYVKLTEEHPDQARQLLAFLNSL